MKKLYTLSFLLVALVSFGQMQDPFNYTGALNANGWVTHSGATPGQLMTSAGSLTYAGLNSTGNKAVLVAGNSEDVNKASTTALTGTVYYSAIVNVVNTTGLNANTATGDYFLATSATAGDGVSPNPQVTSFSARLYVRQGSVANTFNLGILNNSGGAAAPSFSATNYPVNTPIFVVVKYMLASNTASMFVNPTIGGTEGSATATNNTGTTAAPAQIAAIAIRQGGTATAGTGNIEIDEMRLASTYAGVTSANLKVAQNTITGLSVYPNPVVNGDLYVTSDSGLTKSVAIYDVLGKQVLKANVTDQAINVSNLNGGVYIVKVTEDGKTATRKLVIR